MKNKKNIFYILMLLLAINFSFTTKAVYANDEDDIIEDTEDVAEKDEQEKEPATTMIDENPDEENSTSNTATKTDIFENEKGLEDAGDMYKLDKMTADTFQKISDIERENVLMKLKIEQQKLKLDLEKQEVEKRKLKNREIDEERQRKIKIEEEERKLAQEKKKTELEQEKLNAEKKAKEQQEELQNQIKEKIASSDLTDPNAIKSLKTLMATLTGKPIPDLGAGRVGGSDEDSYSSFEDRYKLKSIIGAGGKLSANIENKSKGTTFKVSQGSKIEEWVVEDIRGTSILLKNGTKTKILNIN